MKPFACIAAIAAATLFPAPAHADEGKIQIKLLGTAVLPDGKISEVKSIIPALAGNAAFAAPQTHASDNYVPTIAIEYFFTPSTSLETICCTTQHHVNGDGSLAGTNLVNHVIIVPATFTLKYHLPAGAIKPYIGAGPSVFLMMDAKPGDTAAALGVSRVHLSSELGAALQAGVDVPVSKTGLGISLDAKKYFMSTNAHFWAGNTEALVTRHKLNPWVLSAGLAYRF